MASCSAAKMGKVFNLLLGLEGEEALGEVRLLVEHLLDLSAEEAEREELPVRWSRYAVRTVRLSPARAHAHHTGVPYSKGSPEAQGVRYVRAWYAYAARTVRWLWGVLVNTG